MQDAFARSVLYGEAVPVPLDDAVNWTAAGLLSQDSLNGGSVPVAVPEF